MKIKTSELQGAALDWAVAKCEKVEFTYEDHPHHEMFCMHYSTDWSQGGPIVEREFITIMALEDGGWTASVGELWVAEEGGICGPTPLIAAMRCYVASKLGDEVEIPKALV
jgi:hypothetical protein